MTAVIALFTADPSGGRVTRPRRTKATDGSLALAAPSREAQSVLDATGLTKVLSIYSTEEEAPQACARPPRV